MDPIDNDAELLHRAFARPANVVAVVARMLLGLGLAVTLVLKVYMGIFTDHVCVADSQTLGNAIRCTPTLELLAQTLLLVAGFTTAAVLFSTRPHRLAPPLLIAVTGVLAQVLAGVSHSASLWQTALILTALLAVLAGVFLSLRLPIPASGPQAEVPPGMRG